MVTDQALNTALDRLRHAVPPGSRVFLFGSCAAGTSRRDSDIDLLVVEPQPVDCYREMIRLRRAVGRVGSPVDVLVFDQREFDSWKDTPTTVCYEAATKGREYAGLA